MFSAVLRIADILGGRSGFMEAKGDVSIPNPSLRESGRTITNL
jgi:hypothetical protein